MSRPHPGRAMNPVRAVIVEDEPVLREELRGQLAKLWPDLVVCAEAADGIDALAAIAQHVPHILFLDIEMPGLSGLEVAKQVNGRAHVVFVTAFDRYAVAAFEQGAVDYVMKPFSSARLVTTIARLKEKLAGPPANLDGILHALANAVGGAKPYLRWITASQGSEVRLITVDEISYLQADSKYTLVITPEQQSLVRRPIKDMLEELDPAWFWQIHRSTIVNVNAVAALHRDVGGQLRVKLKQHRETLRVSEPYMHLFKSM